MKTKNITNCNSPIAILLATYNGAKYIREQLQSLSEQSFQDFEIFVHDDFSTDHTIDIIRQAAQDFDLNIHILEDNVKRGARDSFMWLLEHVDASYYMFCDQDDWWLANKIELSFNSIKQLETKSTNKICMCFSDLSITDEKLQIIEPSMQKYLQLDLHLLLSDIGYLSVSYLCSGCTIIFNHNLKKLCFPLPSKYAMHDQWIALIAHRYGNISAIQESTMLYRQHLSNVCGAGPSQEFKFKIFKIFNLMGFYNESRDAFKKIGISYLKALRYKIIYSLQRMNIISGYIPGRHIINEHIDI